LFGKAGYSKIIILNERQSIFGKDNLYAAAIGFNELKKQYDSKNY
jgi:hypothetical protein